MQFEACNDCSGFNFVEYYGDFTCRDCGLVKYSHMVDDRPDYNTFLHILEVGPFQQEFTPPQTRRQSPMDVSLSKLKCTLAQLRMNDTFIDNSIEWVRLCKESMTEKIHDNILFACVSYLVSMHQQRGYDAQFFCQGFGVELIKMWRNFEYILDLMKGRTWYKSLLEALSSPQAKISRMVYELSLDKEFNAWQVIKTAREIFEKIAGCPKLTTAKTKTILASCVIVSCMVHKVVKTEVLLCKQLDISIPTFHHHELVIQETLRKRSKPHKCY